MCARSWKKTVIVKLVQFVTLHIIDINALHEVMKYIFSYVLGQKYSKSSPNALPKMCNSIDYIIKYSFCNQ